MQCDSTHLLAKHCLGWLTMPIVVSVCLIDQSRAPAQELGRSQVLSAAKNATEFLTAELSTRGGYLWRYWAEDTNTREGEGVVNTETVWVQPPGTPSVGEAFVRLYRATGEPVFLEAALKAAEALAAGQMLSGGWQASVEFEPERRKKWAYRTHSKQPARGKDQSSLDDDKSQSAIRFIIQLDAALDSFLQGLHDGRDAVDGEADEQEFFLRSLDDL